MKKLFDELELSVVAKFQKETKNKPKKPVTNKRYESKNIVFLFFTWVKSKRTPKNLRGIITEFILFITFWIFSFQKLVEPPQSNLNKKADRIEEFRLKYDQVGKGKSRHLEINYKAR